MSVFDNPGSVRAKGFDPHQVDFSTIPDSLRIKQRGNDPRYYEITPRPGVNLTPQEYIEACSGISCVRQRPVTMSSYSFELPADFADHEWELPSKGWYPMGRLTVSGTSYRLTFYDSVRLGQTIEDDLERDGLFFEPNLVVIPSVTRADMERAVEWLVESGQFASLTPEE